MKAYLKTALDIIYFPEVVKVILYCPGCGKEEKIDLKNYNYDPEFYFECTDCGSKMHIVKKVISYEKII